MEKAGVSKVEMVIRKCVFWPDGTRKRRTKSHVLAKARDQMSKLVNAVVDQYNEDHNLVEVCSLSLCSAITLSPANTILLFYYSFF